MALPCSRDDNVKHNIDYFKQWANVGDLVAVYPCGIWRGEPFVGEVEKVKTNKFGRISYVIKGRVQLWEAEELFPCPLQVKLKIPYRERVK